ncbi:MAG: hypothetical protein KDA73_03775 [Rhodobacteraceae bacterium]|nr:hypothetical protein [Paracoccaceae bacterium]
MPSSVHRARFGLLCCTLLSAACSVSDDPAQGGFFSGISGVASGGYDARAQALEGNVAQERERQADLTRQLASLEAEYTAERQSLLSRRSHLAASGVVVPGALDRQVTTALETRPSGSDDAARIASLTASIAQLRAASEDLANLGN